MNCSLSFQLEAFFQKQDLSGRSKMFHFTSSEYTWRQRDCFCPMEFCEFLRRSHEPKEKSTTASFQPTWNNPKTTWIFHETHLRHWSLTLRREATLTTAHGAIGATPLKNPRCLFRMVSVIGSGVIWLWLKGLVITVTSYKWKIAKKWV